MQWETATPVCFPVCILRSSVSLVGNLSGLDSPCLTPGITHSACVYTYGKLSLAQCRRCALVQCHWCENTGARKGTAFSVAKGKRRLLDQAGHALGRVLCLFT